MNKICSSDCILFKHCKNASHTFTCTGHREK